MHTHYTQITAITKNTVWSRCNVLVAKSTAIMPTESDTQTTDRKTTTAFLLSSQFTASKYVIAINIQIISEVVYPCVM